LHALQIRSPDADPDSDSDDTSDPADKDAEASESPRAGPTVKHMSFPSNDPAREICGIAEVKHADLVLLARRSRCPERVLGATSSRVATDCACTVAILFGELEQPPRDVLVLHGGDEHDDAAEELAERLRASGARVSATARDDAASAGLGFDLVITGVPGDRDAPQVLRRLQGRADRGCALLFVRAARASATEVSR
jgi:hypothetical protein